MRRRHSSVVEQLFRKQQVLGSNPSVGSIPLSPSGLPLQAANLVARTCPNAEALLTGRFPSLDDFTRCPYI